MYSKRIKIGMIDDSSIVRIFTKAMLSQSTDIVFEVVIEASSLVGIAKVKDQLAHPDVILLDVNMPIMNGIDNIPYVKSIFPKAHIIMFTDDLDSNKIERAFQFGACDYIPKNTNGKVLIERIKRVFFNKIGTHRQTNMAKMDKAVH